MVLLSYFCLSTLGALTLLWFRSGWTQRSLDLSVVFWRLNSRHENIFNLHFFLDQLRTQFMILYQIIKHVIKLPIKIDPLALVLENSQLIGPYDLTIQLFILNVLKVVRVQVLDLILWRVQMDELGVLNLFRCLRLRRVCIFNYLIQIISKITFRRKLRRNHFLNLVLRIILFQLRIPRNCEYNHAYKAVIILETLREGFLT